jgi:protein TonB
MTAPVTAPRLRALLGAAALTLSLPVLAAAEKPVKGDAPDFPTEAVRAGYNEGKVKARVTIEPSGEVSRVEVIDASPRRFFDRSTVRTLSQWRFAPASSQRVVDVDVSYRQ